MEPINWLENISTIASYHPVTPEEMYSFYQERLMCFEKDQVCLVINNMQSGLTNLTAPQTNDGNIISYMIRDHLNSTLQQDLLSWLVENFNQQEVCRLEPASQAIPNYIIPLTLSMMALNMICLAIIHC